MNEIKLLPCPFCGHEASSGESLSDCGGILIYQTGCQKCGCMGPNAPTIEDADVEWNKRVPPKPKESYRCGACGSQHWSAHMRGCPHDN